MESKYFWPSISENTFILSSDLPVGNTFPSELWRPCSVATVPPTGTVGGWGPFWLPLPVCSLSKSITLSLCPNLLKFHETWVPSIIWALCWALSVWKCMFFCSDQFSWFNLIICSALLHFFLYFFWKSYYTDLLRPSSDFLIFLLVFNIPIFLLCFLRDFLNLSLKSSLEFLTFHILSKRIS